MRQLKRDGQYESGKFTDTSQAGGLFITLRAREKHPQHGPSAHFRPSGRWSSFRHSLLWECWFWEGLQATAAITLSEIPTLKLLLRHSHRIKEGRPLMMIMNWNSTQTGCERRGSNRSWRTPARWPATKLPSKMLNPPLPSRRFAPASPPDRPRLRALKVSWSQTSSRV